MKLNLAVLLVIHEVAANLFLGISVILDHLFPGCQGFPFHTCKAICHLSASFQTAMTLPLSEDNIQLPMSLRHLILKKLMDLALKVSQFHRKALSQNFTNLFDRITVFMILLSKYVTMLLLKLVEPFFPSFYMHVSMSVFIHLGLLGLIWCRSPVVPSAISSLWGQISLTNTSVYYLRTNNNLVFWANKSRPSSITKHHTCIV